MRVALLLLAVGVAGSLPEQVHLALAGRDSLGNSNGMTFSWYTEAEGATVVQYGTSPDRLSQNVTGTAKVYYEDHGFHHHAEVTGLSLDTKYYYRVGDGTAWSKVFSFTTAPSSIDATFGVSIFGDMGWLGSEERPMMITVAGLKKNWSAVPTRRQLEEMKNKERYHMMWIVGDIGYADDAFAHDVVGGLYEKCYNGFMNWMENITATMPLMVSPGNHESECHSPECVADVKIGRQLANFSAYGARFNMPSKYSGGVANMWYSWNYGPIHFVSMNTETDFKGAGEEHRGDSDLFPAGGFGRDGEYLAWLEADLKAAHEARVNKAPGYRPFIVAGGHRPCCLGLPGVQELFEKYEVDLYVAGHVHSYARSTRGCHSPACHSLSSTTEKTTYIYAGGPGNDETTYKPDGPSYTPGDSTFHTDELSSGLLTVVNTTALRWELLSSMDGRVLDLVWITRP